ncbi:MAG: IS1595 family transposase [Alphaproteobacteria bacterium]
MPKLTAPIFTDETTAREYLESVRWPDGPFCPFCGQLETVRALPAEGAMGAGWYHCRECRKKFTVRVGTLYERSHVPLHKWLLATHLMVSSKKGMSAHQLHRMLGVTYKTAWFMAHRIREGMRSDDLSPFGSDGGTVEADETFIGRKKGKPVRHGYEHKHKVLSLVDRKTGRARSMVVNDLRTSTVAPIVRENVAREARLMTDEARHYTKVGREFVEHGVVRHMAGEYGRGPIHTNTIEGYFSIFKRGMKGVYQHCGEQHLHRYLAEFDFRYSERAALGVDDSERAVKALKGIEGKRLTYRRADLGPNV